MQKQRVYFTPVPNPCHTRTLPGLTRTVQQIPWVFEKNIMFLQSVPNRILPVLLICTFLNGVFLILPMVHVFKDLLNRFACLLVYTHLKTRSCLLLIFWEAFRWVQA